MEQSAFAFIPAATAVAATATRPVSAARGEGWPAPCGRPVPSRPDEIGFAIGWDHARHGLVPPADHLHGEHPVRLGWQAGRGVFAGRTMRATRHVRRWLALRLQAWLQGRPFEDVMVTPRYLAQIEPARCPVTRETLTDGLGAPTDAVVVALNPEAGVAAGHLAVVSRRAAQALDRGTAGDGSDPTGLDAAACERLAALCRLATPTDHRAIAAEPLAVLPPNRLRLLNPVQALQAVISRAFDAPAWGRRIGELGALMPDARARRALAVFASALLAHQLAACGGAAQRAPVAQCEQGGTAPAGTDARRHALEDAWVHPVVRLRWAALAAALDRADCERIVRLAQRRGLAGGTRWLDDAQATEGWALEAAEPATA